MSLRQRQKLVSDRRLFIFGPNKTNSGSKHLRIQARWTTDNGQQTLLKNRIFAMNNDVFQVEEIKGQYSIIPWPRPDFHNVGFRDHAS